MIKTTTTDSQPYPVRDKFHSHKLTRALFTSGAAQELSAHAMLLIIHIAHVEDELRYRGAVKLWNNQISDALGFRSPKQLNDARREAVEAGWLVYERQHDRAVGRYFTILPEESAELSRPSGGWTDDVPFPKTERKRSRSFSEFGTENGKGNGKGNGTESGKGSGKPPIPIPDPLPVPGLIDRLKEEGLEDFQRAEIQERTKELVSNTGIDQTLCLQFVAVAYCLSQDFCEELLKRFDPLKASKRRQPVDNPKRYLTTSLVNECRKHKLDWETLKDQVPVEHLAKPVERLYAPRDPKVIPGTDELFSQWWEVYPRKEGEHEARRAFCVALPWIKSAQRMSALDEALAYLKARTIALSPQLVDGGIEFCPMPATWLETRRFMDAVRQKESRVPDLRSGCKWNATTGEITYD